MLFALDGVAPNSRISLFPNLTPFLMIHASNLRPVICTRLSITGIAQHALDRFYQPFTRWTFKIETGYPACARTLLFSGRVPFARDDCLQRKTLRGKLA